MANSYPGISMADVLKYSQSQQKKLKILCLHGFNNTKEAFEFMTKGFRDLFSEMADFYFMDAPLVIDPAKMAPEPALVSRGF